MNRSLLIMAGGMGSRYGGLKQVDSFGPNNESILDYSIYDAIKVGFNKIVILSSPKLKDYFVNKYQDIFSNLDNIGLEIVTQDPNYGLKNFTLPQTREKPWGTGHAVLCCENVINEPFATINADDFYGYGAFDKVYDSLNYIVENNIMVSTISYLIENTLSENGGVSRGVCITDNKKLIGINETHDLEMKGNIIYGHYDDNKVEHVIGTQVAMNLFGFQDSIFSLLREEFKIFLEKNINEKKNEFLLPEVIGKEIKNNVFVDTTNENWFGVTYKDDSEVVRNKIKELVERNIYPSPLWK